jgi:small subunit ribosomal protein S16
MVKIRLKKTGRRNHPCFRIVVQDQRTARQGKVIENLGSYDPMRETDNITLKNDRAEYWLSKGAQPTDATRPILKRQGVKLPGSK